MVSFWQEGHKKRLMEVEPSEGEAVGGRATKWKWKSWRLQLLKVGRGEEARMSQRLLLLILGSPVGASHWFNSTGNLPAQKPGAQSSEVTLGRVAGQRNTENR